jgi:hypothetical protein
MKASISEIVGRAPGARSAEVVVYRALRVLLCSRCGAEIREGELFTRKKLVGVRISPFCEECAPFELPQRNNLCSPLIETLLRADSTAGGSRQTLSSPDMKSREKEVERRLGPALAISRKRRR